jgi:uncharacterized protein YecT (DUF1311 family)
VVVFAEEMLAAKERAAASERARAVEAQLEAERRNVEEQARISREETERAARAARERAAAERAERERLDRERIEADRVEHERLERERLERERVERERSDSDRTEPERRAPTRLSSAIFAGIKIALVVYAIQWLYSHIPGWWEQGKEAATSMTSSERSSTAQQPSVTTENAKDSRQVVTTPFGKVSISSSHSLLLDDREINPAITGDFGLILDTPIPFGDRYAILVTSLSGGTACPAMYRWLLLTKSGHVVSKEFGTCSDMAQPSMRGGRLTVTMPGNGGDEVQYSYDGSALTEKRSAQATANDQGAATAGLSSEFSKCMSEAGGITMDVMECLNQETSVQEERMNNALQQLEAKLSGRERADLKNTQLAWKEQVDRHCASAADVGGTAKIVGEADCFLKQMSRRAKELESWPQNQMQDRIGTGQESSESPSNAIVPKLVLLNFPVEGASKIVTQMLTAVMRGDERAHIAAQASLRSLDGPVRGDRKAARTSNAAALDAIRRGDHTLATRLLLAATEADPADPEIVGNLAFSLHKLALSSPPATWPSQLESARSAAIAAIFLSPERTAGWGELASILADQGYRDSAVAAFQVELKVSKNQEKMREALQATALDETQSVAVRNAITQMLSK